MENEFQVSSVKSRSQNTPDFFSGIRGGQVLDVERTWARCALFHLYFHCGATIQDISLPKGGCGVRC